MSPLRQEDLVMINRSSRGYARPGVGLTSAAGSAIGTTRTPLAPCRRSDVTPATAPLSGLLGAPTAAAGTLPRESVPVSLERLCRGRSTSRDSWALVVAVEGCVSGRHSQAAVQECQRSGPESAVPGGRVGVRGSQMGLMPLPYPMSIMVNCRTALGRGCRWCGTRSRWSPMAR